jgi:hypothetical protein
MATVQRVSTWTKQLQSTEHDQLTELHTGTSLERG